MAIVVRVAGESGSDDFHTLLETLTGYDALRGRVRSATRPARDGEMGELADALAIALGPGGAATAFAAGVALWLRNQRLNRRRKVEVTIELPDGGRVRVTGDGIEDAATVIAAAVKPWTSNS